MKLKNHKSNPLAVEIFLGPGEWFKVTAEAGAVFEVPDELADAVKAQYGVVDAPKAKAEK